MRIDFRRGSLAAAVILAAPLGAQSVTRPHLPMVEVAPYAGVLVAPNLVDGPLGTSISGGSGTMGGLQLGIPLDQTFSVIGNVAYASGDLRIGLPLVGGMSVGKSATWLYDGGLQVTAPAMARGSASLVPFAQAGVGAMRHNIDATSVVSSHSTNFAWNVGAGLDFALDQSVAVRLLVKDYVGRFDFKEATGLSVDDKAKSNWALSAGIKLAF